MGARNCDRCGQWVCNSTGAARIFNAGHRDSLLLLSSKHIKPGHTFMHAQTVCCLATCSLMTHLGACWRRGKDHAGSVRHPAAAVGAGVMLQVAHPPPHHALPLAWRSPVQAPGAVVLLLVTPSGGPACCRLETTSASRCQLLLLDPVAAASGHLLLRHQLTAGCRPAAVGAAAGRGGGLGLLEAPGHLLL